jgi:hydroxysqualene synthase
MLSTQTACRRGASKSTGLTARRPSRHKRPRHAHSQWRPVSVDHYENFPVASVLCPPRLRPAVVAIYHFARTADDIADEGQASAEARLADLAAYRADLDAVFASKPSPSKRWPQVFEPLATQVHAHALPHKPLAALLNAFARDAHNPVYAERAALLDYCRESANPIGRLLLHLYGIQDARSLAQSDAICSALQLINFWQDLSVDLPRGRCYVPLADARRHGLSVQALPRPNDNSSPHAEALLADLIAWAEGLMQQGAPLAQELPGRIGWELRMVVQGGLRIIEKLRQGAARGRSGWVQRPRLHASDAPLLLWRALRQPAGAAP